MPMPVARDLHVDRLLTQVSIGYTNLAYIADDLFPMLPVEKQSDKIASYDQSHWFRNAAQLRAPGTRSERGGYTVDLSQTYFCDRYSFGREIPDQVRQNADAPFNLDREAVDFVMDKIKMNREVAWAGAYFKTGVWGTDYVAGTDFTAWDDYAGSTPLIDVDTFKDAIETKIGREPNVFVISKQVWLKMKYHPEVVDLIKYTQRGGPVTEALWQELLGFPKFRIGRAIYTTDPEGTAEASVTYSRIWGKHAAMFYVPDAPSLMTPAAGYTFVWRVVPSAFQYVKRMRDEEREVDIIEVNSYYNQKLLGARSGAFLENVVS